MTTLKLTTAAVAALTLAVAVSAPTSQAEAKWKGGGVALGVGIAGALIGSAIAANHYAAPSYAPAYVGGYGLRRCTFVREFDDFGILRRVRVCGPVY